MSKKQDLFNEEEFIAAIQKAIEEPCDGYDDLYTHSKALMQWLFWKKYLGNEAHMEDMFAEAHINIYKEFILKGRGLETVQHLFNLVVTIIERSFLEYLSKLKRVNLDKQEALDIQSTWHSDIDTWQYTQPELLLIYNEALKRIRFTDQERLICKYFLFVQVFDRRRYEFDLPKPFRQVAKKQISLYKHYVKVLHTCAIMELIKGGAICLKKF